MASLATEATLWLVFQCVLPAASADAAAPPTCPPATVVLRPPPHFMMGPIGENRTRGVGALEELASGLPDVDLLLPSIELVGGRDAERVYAFAEAFSELPAYGTESASGYTVVYRTDDGDDRLVALAGLQDRYSNRIKRFFPDTVVEHFYQNGALPARPGPEWEFILLIPLWQERLVANLEILLLKDLGLSPQDVELMYFDLATTAPTELPTAAAVRLKTGHRMPITQESRFRVETALRGFHLSEK